MDNNQTNQLEKKRGGGKESKGKYWNEKKKVDDLKRKERRKEGR